MNFYFRTMYLLLLCNAMIIFGATVPERIKTLPEYDEFVLKNKLSQDIVSLLQGRSDWDKEEIMKYIYSETDLISFPYSIAHSDKVHIDGIRRKIQNLSYLAPREAQEVQDLTSTCLKSLPKRGIKYAWSTILYCFTLTEKKMLSGKY